MMSGMMIITKILGYFSVCTVYTLILFLFLCCEIYALNLVRNVQ